MRRIGILFLVFGLFVAACGDGEETSTETTAAADSCAIENLTLVQPGMLTVATGEPAFPPWIIDDDPTNKQGFEGSVAYAIAEGLGFADDQVQWIRTDFNEAIAPGPKDFDFNIQQYSITAERDEVVDFSEPYYVTAQALVAYSDSAVVAATSLADLKGYRLGAQLGTTSFDYIENIIEPEEPASVYDTNADAKSALDAKQVDALVFDLPTAFYITAVEIPEAGIVGVLPTSEQAADRFGLLLPAGSTLKPCLDAVIGDLRDDGTLDGLADEWLVSGSDLPTLAP